MSHIKSGLIAAVFTAAIATPAAAGGCCASSWGWGYNGGCCGASYAVTPVIAYQPVVTYQQVATPPQLVYSATTNVYSQTTYSYGAVGYEPVAAYAVNQGPVYSGPGTDYSPAYYQPATQVGAYPYVGGYYGAPAYRPYRKYRSYSWGRPYRPYYGVRKAYRWSGYHHRPAPRYHAPAAKYYHYK